MQPYTIAHSATSERRFQKTVRQTNNNNQIAEDNENFKNTTKLEQRIIMFIQSIRNNEFVHHTLYTNVCGKHGKYAYLPVAGTIPTSAGKYTLT